MSSEAPASSNSAGSESTGIFMGLGSFTSHLSELATRLKRSIIAYVVALALISSLPNPLHPFGGPNSFYGYNFLLTYLIRYAQAVYTPSLEFYAVSPTDPVFAFVNVSMILALLVTLPYIFYQIYGFVAPGLYQREKRAVRKYVLPFSLLLTVGGFFGLLVIFPTVMRILIAFYPVLGVAPLISIDSFINFLIYIPLMTGLAFTFPVFIIPLVEMRVLKAQQLSKARWWIYVIVALAVSIANPDPTDISSIPIVLPIIVLFEITILVSKRIEKNRARNVTVQGQNQSQV